MIALICDQNERELTAMLSRYDEVTVFGDGVALAYYLQRGNPCTLAVIAAEGAAGMNFCTYVRHQRNSLPMLWITEQQAFLNQSKRLAVDGFLVKPSTGQEIQQVAQSLLQARQ